MSFQLLRIARRIRSKILGPDNRPLHETLRIEKRAPGPDPFAGFRERLGAISSKALLPELAPIDERKQVLMNLLSGELHETSFRHKIQKMDAGEVFASVSSPSVGLDLIHIGASCAPEGWRVELGSAFGLGTIALALAETQSTNPVDGIEFEAWRAEIADSGAREILPDRAAVHPGAIEDILPKLAPDRPRIGFAFVDAMHTHEATMGYHRLIETHATPGAFVLYDDLSWSSQMERAWRDIVAAPSVTDALRIGLRWGLVRYA